MEARRFYMYKLYDDARRNRIYVDKRRYMYAGTKKVQLVQEDLG
jgi:hypothetical protein